MIRVAPDLLSGAFRRKDRRRSVNIPHCPKHGDVCMPMIRVGVWWCPTGEHLVMVATPITAPRPQLRLIRPAA